MRRIPTLFLAMLAITLIGCGSDAAGPEDTSSPGGSTTTPPPPEPTTPPSADPTTPATGDGEPVPGPVELRLQEVAVADAPIDAAVNPGSNVVYIAERAGRVRTLEDGELGDPVFDLTDETRTDSERGLLSIAFSLDGSTLYVHYSDDDGDSVISAVPLLDGRAGSERVLLQVAQPFSNHNGGQLLVDDQDRLLIGLGDGGSGGDPEGNGQDTSTLLGTILRIDPAGDPYAVPPDNPFADGGGAPEILLYGLRNPWRFTLDEGLLWIGDVGQDAIEEIDRLPVDDGPRNLGWNAFEGTSAFSGEDAVGDVVEPVYQYPRAQGCAVTGGIVYRGAAIPDLAGSYIFGDYCTAELWSLDSAGTNFRSLDVEVEQGELVSFAPDPDGEILVLSLAGPISRVVPA